MIYNASDVGHKIFKRERECREQRAESYRSPITNKLSDFIATPFREFESSLKNIYLLLLIGL